jgi:hypothetical protein
MIHNVASFGTTFTVSIVRIVNLSGDARLLLGTRFGYSDANPPSLPGVVPHTWLFLLPQVVRKAKEPQT